MPLVERISSDEVMNGNTVSNLTALLFIIAFLLVNMADFGSWIIFAAVLTVSLVLGSTTL